MKPGGGVVSKITVYMTMRSVPEFKNITKTPSCGTVLGLDSGAHFQHGTTVECQKECGVTVLLYKLDTNQAMECGAAGILR